MYRQRGGRHLSWPMSYSAAYTLQTHPKHTPLLSKLDAVRRRSGAIEIQEHSATVRQGRRRVHRSSERRESRPEALVVLERLKRLLIQELSL